MTTKEDLENIVRQEPLIDRLEKSESMIGKMCAEGRPPKMSIPVDAMDEDFFIQTTLRDAAEALCPTHLCPECGEETESPCKMCEVCMAEEMALSHE